MTRTSMLHAGAALAIVVLTANAAQAQNVVSATNDFTLSFSSPLTFSGESALYAPSFAYDATAGTTGFNLSLYTPYSSLTFNDGGGITVTPPSPPYGAYQSPLALTITGNGTSGYWGADYNTPSVATLGTHAGLVTLNVAADSGVDFSGIDYFSTLFVPGTWDLGTGTGDYGDLSCTFGCTVSYANGDTIFTESTSGYSGQLVDLNVTLYGGPVTTPLPSTWTLLLAGFVGLGFFAYRETKNRSAIAAA